MRAVGRVKRSEYLKSFVLFYTTTNTTIFGLSECYDRSLLIDTLFPKVEKYFVLLSFLFVNITVIFLSFFPHHHHLLLVLFIQSLPTIDGFVADGVNYITSFNILIRL